MPGKLGPELFGVVLYPGVAELVDDDIINQCKGELYGFGVQDNVVGIGAAAPVFLPCSEITADGKAARFAQQV